MWYQWFNRNFTKLREYFLFAKKTKITNIPIALLSMYGQKLSDFIKNILICVPKMNKGLTGLERHEGEQLMTELKFLGELPL